MIDWLRGELQDPAIDIAGRKLPVAIRRHTRARRLTMRLAPDGTELRVTLPSWGGTRDALAFAHSRQEWIARQLARVPKTVSIENGINIPYRGQPVTIAWRKGGPRKIELVNDALVFGGPEDRMAARVQRWLESEALRLANEDLHFYCERAGLTPPELRLTRARRRWGSCAGDRQARCIRINWRLVMAPDHVRRSVVAHEVAHLVHFDHSPAFHRLLGQLFEGDIRRADTWLKDEGRTLYAAFG